MFNLYSKGMMLEPLDVEDAVGVEKELTHPADQQQVCYVGFAVKK